MASFSLDTITSLWLRSYFYFTFVYKFFNQFDFYVKPILLRLCVCFISNMVADTTFWSSELTRDKDGWIKQFDEEKHYDSQSRRFQELKHLNRCDEVPCSECRKRRPLEKLKEVTTKSLRTNTIQISKVMTQSLDFPDRNTSLESHLADLEETRLWIHTRTPRIRKESENCEQLRQIGFKEPSKSNF